MRISGGTATGISLKVPAGLGVRPMPDRVRQAVFNSLGSRILDARILEPFGGTGALGLEALSRGAASVVCIEKSVKHAAFIRANLHASGLPSHCFHLRVADAFTAIAQLRQAEDSFHLILADPPFGPKNKNQRSTSPSQRLLDDPNLPFLLAPNGLLILSHTTRDTLTIPVPWLTQRTLKHGDATIQILHLAPNQA